MYLGIKVRKHTEDTQWGKEAWSTQKKKAGRGWDSDIYHSWKVDESSPHSKRKGRLVTVEVIWVWYLPSSILQATLQGRGAL